MHWGPAWFPCPSSLGKRIGLGWVVYGARPIFHAYWKLELGTACPQLPVSERNWSSSVRLSWAVLLNFTRNTHAHLCLALVHRLCARIIYAAGYRWGARGTCYYSCVRCSLYPAAMAPLHLHHQRTLSSTINIWVERIWMSDSVTHISLHTAGLYLWYATTFLSVTHHVRMYAHTHIRTLWE